MYQTVKRFDRQKVDTVRLMQVKELLKKDYIKRLVKGIDEIAANGGNACKVYIDWIFNDDWI